MLLTKYEVRINCHYTIGGVGSNDNNDPPSITCSIFFYLTPLLGIIYFMRMQVSYQLKALNVSCFLS
jgi:hypothetical protein